MSYEFRVVYEMDIYGLGWRETSEPRPTEQAALELCGQVNRGEIERARNAHAEKRSITEWKAIDPKEGQ